MLDAEPEVEPPVVAPAAELVPAAVDPDVPAVVPVPPVRLEAASHVVLPVTCTLWPTCLSRSVPPESIHDIDAFEAMVPPDAPAVVPPAVAPVVDPVPVAVPPAADPADVPPAVALVVLPLPVVDIPAGSTIAFVSMY